MEITPEAVREGKFREALRGYHRDDVDEFLERVAAGISVLQERLRQANDRAARAESQATEAAEVDSSLRRTLVLAQRTADLAVEEARREAAQLVEEAQAHRDGMMAELAAERDQLREETQKAIQDEVYALHETRARLLADVTELGQYYERQREWLRAALAEQLRVLDDDEFDMGAPPAVHEIDPAVVNGSAAPVTDDTADATEAMGVADETVAGGDVADVADVADDGDDAGGAGAAAHAEEAEGAGSAEPAADVASSASSASSTSSASSAPADNGVAGDSAAAFLSELQRVIDTKGGGESSDDDDDVLPPPDERARAFFDADDEVAARRFGALRRRRRRP